MLEPARVGWPDRGRRAGCDFAIRWCARRSTGRRRRRSGGECIERWRRRPTRRSTRTGAHGTWPRRRPALTRMSPPSWSGPPDGRRREAGWPPRPRFWSGPATLTPAALAARTARAGGGAGRVRSGRARRRARSAGDRGDGRCRTTSNAAACSCCALRSRSPHRRGSDAPPLLLEAARELEAVDPALARATYLEALSAAMFTGRLARGGGVVEISEAALAGPPPPEPPRSVRSAPPGVGGPVHGRARGGRPDPEGGASCFPGRRLCCRRRRLVGSGSRAGSRFFSSTTRPGRCSRRGTSTSSGRAGALTALPFVLANRSSVYAFFGDLGAAAAYEEELRAATEATGIATVPYGALALAALRGHEAELTELIRTTVSDAQARGEGLALTITEFLSGTLYLGLGRYDAALTAVGQAERYLRGGRGDLGADRADRGGRPVRTASARGRGAAAGHGGDPRQRDRLGALDRGPVPRTAQ